MSGSNAVLVRVVRGQELKKKLNMKIPGENTNIRIYICIIHMAVDRSGVYILAEEFKRNPCQCKKQNIL